MSRVQRVLVEQGDGMLLGAGAYFYDPIFLEIAAGLGFRIVWFDMEHCLITFSQAADLCRIASGLGLLTMIRIPDTRRENVLRAAECGPDIIDVPMANSPEVLHELVRHARFRPEGERGSFSSSRASRYGLPNYVEEQQRINRDLCLMGQIETAEALERLDEICAVPGTDIFIGPLDLSASVDVLGQTAHPRVAAASETIVRTARQHGKLVAVAAPSADAALWTKLGVDVFFCANDVSCMKTGAQTALRQAKEALAHSRAAAK
jgi:2-keto-3-deoxy-L-rhamnonate aldolase RhmA